MGNMTDEGEYDNSGIMGKYNSLYNDTYRQTFINKGAANVPVSTRLTISSTSGFAKGKEDFDLIEGMRDGVNNNMIPKMGLSGSQIRDIAAFIKGRNITLREYLAQNGFAVFCRRYGQKCRVTSRTEHL